MVAVLALAAWLFGAGSLVSFISETVMTGFKTGVALHLASTQLPKLSHHAHDVIGPHLPGGRADLDLPHRFIGVGRQRPSI